MKQPRCAQEAYSALTTVCLFSLLARQLLKPADVKMDKPTREAENEEKRNAGNQEEV